VIIDCHGHFTTEPPAFHAHRRAQIAFACGEGPAPEPYEGVDEAELRDIIAQNQLRLQRERGTDLTIISPRASGMGHHIPDEDIAISWATLSNDTVARIAALYPGNFAAACQLPQTAGGGLDAAVAELERCADAGFVACNVNPDPSGGRWDGPPLTDPSWDPLWSALERLDMPAMIHVSASDRHGVHTTGAHYLAADTIVFMQLLGSDLFDRHPALRLVIPHGGGAVPFHWGRYRGIANKLGDPGALDRLMQHVFFDTCVYHQPGIDLLLEVVDSRNILFGSELLGAVTGDDPDAGGPIDDTRRYIERSRLTDSERWAVFEGNVRRVYPRLDARLNAQGRVCAPPPTEGEPHE